MMSKRIVKQLVLVIALSWTTHAYAVAAGFYMGLMGGPSKSGAKDQKAFIEQTPPAPTIVVNARPTDKYQFASRFYLGNKINPYVGFELGLGFNSKIKYPLQPFGSPGLRVRWIDVVGSASMPIRSFEIYGKAGVGYTYVAIPGDFSNNGKSQYKSGFAPTFSVGGSYDFNQNWVADISINSLMVSGITGTINYTAIGLSYHFVDKFCGQFLCDD